MHRGGEKQELEHWAGQIMKFMCHSTQWELIWALSFIARVAWQSSILLLRFKLPPIICDKQFEKSFTVVIRRLNSAVPICSPTPNIPSLQLYPLPAISRLFSHLCPEFTLSLTGCPVCETFLKTSLLYLEVSLSRSQLRIFLMSSSSRPIICILEIRTSFEIVSQNTLSFSFLDSLMSSILPFPSPHSILKLLISISEHFSLFSEESFTKGRWNVKLAPSVSVSCL